VGRSAHGHVDQRSAPVLIVEDNAGTRAALASLLNFVGYTTVTTRTAEEALAYLAGGSMPAVVILDVDLPGMDGATFRTRLLADPRLAAVPVIVYTALPDVHVPDVVGRLSKSVDPDRLLALVADACARGGSSSGSLDA
jgi:CheY-like chemotaxis protein